MSRQKAEILQQHAREGGMLGTHAQVAGYKEVKATRLYNEYGFFGKILVSLDSGIARNVTGMPISKVAEELVQADILRKP